MSSIPSREGSLDVAVIGAGPAGLTLAGLLAKYRPGTRVEVFERARIGQPKIGESLLVDVNRILEDLGALEAVEAAGFSTKHGVTFVWGGARERHTFLWREGKAAVDPPEGYQLDYTWHVDRYRYDAILADAARARGVTIHEEAAATDVLMDGDRVAGVVIKRAGGEVERVRARFVIDCAGKSGPLARTRSGRTLDEQLRNIAVFGYLDGVRWDEALSGPADERRTAVITHPRGWVWLIPLAGDRASVGFVTTLERFRADGPPADLSRYHADALRELPEHEALFGAATRIDYRGDGQLVRSVQEYSYQCARVEGPGWALCGDAAGFVDAILSIGCFVAQAHAQFLACALATALDAPERERFALECYETVVRENLAAFRAVAHMFYAFNDTATEFWAACRDELRKGTLIPDARDKEASLAFFSGFSARNALYDTALGSLGGTFLTDVGGQLFKREALFKEDPMGERAAWAKRLARSDRALRLARGVELRPFALPRVEDGRLAPLTRVELSVDGHRRHLYVPDALAPAVRAFDGTRSIAAIARELAAGDAHAEAAYRTEAMKLAYRLLCMGALEDQGARGAA